MPSRDATKRREQMRRWRQANPDQIALYDAERRPPMSEETKEKRRTTQRVWAQGNKKFVGCDGEGMGDGAAHRYYVFRIGDNVLKTGEPLTSWELLWFIAEQPPGPTYVIFSGNYDFTMILRDAPRDFVKDLLDRKGRERDNGIVRPAAWGNLRVDYIPHKRLSVKIAGGSSVIIHDVFGFLQCSFVQAIDEWDIGTPEERGLVQEGKARRGDSDVLSGEELEYNRIECVLLAQLVKKMDDTAKSLGISMAPYEGSGALANSLLRIHVSNPLKRSGESALFTRELDPAVTLDYPTWDAYFGGRFEITAHGPINQPVYEYDINSAYPAVIRMLPCLWHGHWRRGKVPRGHGRRPDTILPMLGHIRWNTNAEYPFGPVPHRNKQGNVTFPLRGSGWYWSVEWPRDEGTEYEVDDCYWWEQTCEHRPFHWVEDRYNQRRDHKRAGRKGQALQLKYGYNSLYGKFVQSVGVAPWRNSVYGGLITATCRRWLRDAAEQRPFDIVMFATDGLYSLSPLDLRCGEELGQWEAAVYDDGLHLVRPGIYFSPDGEAKIKTRGIGRTVVQEYAQQIKESFNQIYDHPEWLTSITGRDIKKWGTPIEYNGLISIRLAHSQNRPEKAGYFGTLPHFMSYDIGPKRVPLDFDNFGNNWVEGILRSAAPPIGYPTESVGYESGRVAETPYTTDSNDELDILASAPDGGTLAGEQLELEM